MAGKMVWGIARQSGRLHTQTYCLPPLPCWRRPKAFARRQGQQPCVPPRPHKFNSCAAAFSALPEDSNTSQDSHHTEGGAKPGNLVLYNSLSRKKEVFKPRATDGTVSMYVCGVTVYDYSHIGHARVYTSFDVLYRYLRHLGYKVQYVRNFTDIDDKIINRAREVGSSPQELSNRFIREFHTDMEALSCLPPTLEPKATEYIAAIITDIKQIIHNGYGYQSGGDINFDISKLREYGLLSGRKQDDNRPGERVAVDGRKRNAGDFVLWKAGKPGEPQWDSPWGPGRPGWHIECSAMIRDVMGPAIDIHGGGRDLLFPHHENELAQAQAAVESCDCGHQPDQHDFVNYWMHNGFVNVNSEKMSKSLGNFFTIRDVMQQYHPLALRLLLVSSQYRAPINYTQRALDSAAVRIYYIYQTLSDCELALSDQPVQADQAEGSSAHEMIDGMHGGLADDLNTSRVLSALSEPLKQVNDFCHTKQGRKAKGRLEELANLWSGFKIVLDVLGLWRDDPQAVLLEMRDLVLRRAGLTEADVLAAIDRRAEARKAKDFAMADQVREEMASKGIQIMDTPQGTTWRPNSSPEDYD